MNKIKISIIVAMDEKRGIGKNNALMWKIPGELPRFKRITSGHPIIMGRKTYESIGKPLPNRTNIVITRNSDLFLKSHPEFISGFSTECFVVGSLEEAMQKTGDVEGKKQAISSEPHPEPSPERRGNEKEIFVIGGGQILHEALSVVDRLYLTLVKGDFGADVFFPEYNEFTKVIEKEDHEEGGYKFQFLTLER